MVPNPLNANHNHEKPKAETSHQIPTTAEALYMTSDVGNKKPPQNVSVDQICIDLNHLDK